VERYVRNDTEHRSLSAQGPLIIAPNFRGDWAYDQPLIENVECSFHHEGFIEAARRIFDTDRIRPQQLYSNITWQLPFPQGNGHTDVPAFRGIDRTRYPIWFLVAMGRSGLFEDERIRIATAVAWFYEGEDGGFEYWPDGPDAAPHQHQGKIGNTAIVGDNDKMFHRVMPVGDPKKGLLSGMTLDTRLERTADGWRIAEQDRTLAAPAWPELRISVSWKALAFRDAAEERAYDEHSDDLSLDQALQRLQKGLEDRGICCSLGSDPLNDPAFVDALTSAYGREPTQH